MNGFFVFYFGVSLYFILMCCVIWLVAFPAGRDSVVNLMQLAGARLNKKYSQWRYGVAGDSGALEKAAIDLRISRQSVMNRYIPWLFLAGSLVALPPVVVLLMSGRNVLDGFDDTHVHEANDQVTALLEGERMVAPPPLPPEMFATQEVLRIRPSLIDASRNWQLLDQDFSQRLLLVFRIMKERYGYDMAILEGYRSPERQNRLANMGDSVTNATAFQSYHQFGLAADCAFKRDGKLVISEKDPWAMRGYQLYGEIAESLGMRWGGRWKMMDFGHIEFRKPDTVRH